MISMTKTTHNKVLSIHRNSFQTSLLLLVRHSKIMKMSVFLRCRVLAKILFHGIVLSLWWFNCSSYKHSIQIWENSLDWIALVYRQKLKEVNLWSLIQMHDENRDEKSKKLLLVAFRPMIIGSCRKFVFGEITDSL